MKTRSMAIRLGSLEVSTSWANSTLTFVDYRNAAITRKVILSIEDPGDIEYIRDRLSEIEAYWRKRLGVTVEVPRT